MKQQVSPSILAAIAAGKDAQAAKLPCFPTPYTLVMVHKPASGGKKGVIPYVRLKNIKGGYELRRCDSILKPKAGEPIDFYMNRLECELTLKEVNNEMVL